jgi:hypothetical protein
MTKEQKIVRIIKKYCTGKKFFFAGYATGSIYTSFISDVIWTGQSFVVYQKIDSGGYRALSNKLAVQIEAYIHTYFNVEVTVIDSY